uniref:Apoptosis inducing factor mitochondria associated 5 n=1 Tax=Salarias fasciatus TaxID=181472 RepID=A0A672GB54_SALFA
MMEVEVGHHSVLLTRTEGRYSAIGNQCTHYGAPLSKGILSGHRVRCPWHGACFNVLTGDMEEYPGMDCLPCHKVGSRKVYVSTLRQEKRIKSMGSAVPGVTHTIILLGGGAASLSCAEILRQERFGGRIIMVTRDDLLPYDKTRLSKVMNVESETILLRRREFFHQYDIEVWLRKEALSVDTDKKTVAFDDGSVQSYDQLLISTGSGTLFSVQMLSERNVKFYMNDNVTEVKGVDGKVKEVVLKSGKVIPADVLIVGVGIFPNSQFLQGSKITMDSKHFVIVDKYMRTNVPDVFCAGDLATFPLAMAKNRLVNIGHWQMAQAHGNGGGSSKFLALYIKDDEVIAAAGLNYDPAVSAVAERLVTGNVITKAEAQSDDLSWLQLS